MKLFIFLILFLLLTMACATSQEITSEPAPEFLFTAQVPSTPAPSPSTTMPDVKSLDSTPATTTSPAQSSISSLPAWAPIGQFGGPSTVVAVQGNYAYINVGPRLLILNITDSDQPVVAGRSSALPGFESLAVAGEQAYIAAGVDGLRIIDVSNPGAPAEVGFLDTRGPARNILLVEDLAYIATGEGLQVVDISNPIAPVAIGFYDTPDAIWDVAVSDHIAYLAEAFSENAGSSERGGLRLVDIADPADPKQIGFFPMNPNQASAFDVSNQPRGARNVAVSGDQAFVTYRTERQGGLLVLDISDPAAPIQIGDYRDYIYYVSDVAVLGDPPARSVPIYAYLATGINFGLLVLDMSDPGQPIVLDDAVSGWAQGLAVVGDRLLIADERGGLLLVEISDPSRPIEVGSYGTVGDARSIAGFEDRAYVGDGLRDLWLVDVSDPTEVEQLGLYTAPGDIKKVFAAGVTTYIAAETAGLLLVDFSDPANPVQIGSLETPGLAYDVAVEDGFAYVLDGQMQIINVSDPAAPVLVTTYDSVVRPEKVVVTNGTAYLASADGLHLVDVSNQDLPQEIGFYATMELVDSVAVVANHAYVLAGGVLQIVDVSDPEHAVQLGRYHPPGDIRYVTADGDYVYLAGENTLIAVDVSDPTSPKELSNSTVPNPIYGIAAGQDRVYVAGGAGGLVVFGAPSPTDTMISGTVRATPTRPPSSLLIPQNLEVIGPDNVARMEQLAELPISGATQLAFSPGGGEFAIGKDDGSIEMWSAVTGRLLMKVKDGEENRPVRQLGFTSDGTLLLSSTSETGANNPVTFVWEPATGEMVHSYSESPAALSPDGRFLAIVTGSANKSVEIVDLATGEVVITLAEPNELYLLGLAYSADGLWLVGSAAGVDRSGTTIWQAENGELLGTLDEVSNLALSPSSFQAAASDMSQLSIYDTESWTVIQELSGDGDLKFSSIGYSTDGSFVAGAFGDRVKLFSTDTWQESAVLPAKNVYGISFSPDQRLMASYTFGGSVQLWGIISEASVESGPPVTNLVNRQQLMDLAWAALDPNTSSHNQADWEVVEVRQATGHEVSGYFSAEPELACPGPEPPANKLIDPSTTYGFVDMRPWPATPVSPDPPISPTAPPNVPEPFLQRALFLLDLDSGQIIARALSCIIY